MIVPDLNHLKKFAQVLLFTFIIHVVSRHLLLFFNWNEFNITTSQFLKYFFFGLRFDLSSFAYANVFFFLLFMLPTPLITKKTYKIIAFWIWLLFNLLFVISNIADAFYYPFVLRRSTFDAITLIFTMKSEISLLWVNFIVDFWPAFVIFMICVYIMVRMYLVIMKNHNAQLKGLKDFFTRALYCITFFALSVIAMRGGFQTKPISLVTAGRYAPPGHTALILNSAFSIVRTYGKTSVDRKNFFSNDAELKQAFDVCKQYPGGNFNYKNIVIIILEGFSNEHLNSINQVRIDQNKNFAPFLDSLIHKGMYFKNAYANGKRSVEGIPAILSSMPTLMNTPFILSPYVNNNIESLPQILKSMGYRSYFFHGGQNGTMNLDAYALKAGFDMYFGKNEYPDKNDFDGKWGIWDKPYLAYVVEQLNRVEEPFFASVFTLSSHHPYNVPEKYRNILPEGPLPIHKSIAYADLALKDFFDKASGSDWFSNTLFVITSDHSSEPYTDFYKGPAGKFSIPLLFYDPQNHRHEILEKVCQQTDIMPSILHYIGYSEKFTAFGNSIFDSVSTGMNITYHTDSYQLLVDSLAIVFADDTPVAMWNYLSDIQAISNKINDESYSAQLHRLTQIYRSFIQQYNNSLIENKFSCTFAR